MSIHHKFKKHDWNNGFYTNSSILHTPYDPEVIIIGTFNHGWNWNSADFFYGRDMYMWPILANLFLNNSNIFVKPRNKNNEVPTLEEIFEICKRGKLSFADIVSGTKQNISLIQNEHSCFINNNFEWNNYSDKYLNLMGDLGWLDDNIDDIVNYINQKETIKEIYFTFNSEKWLLDKKNRIKSKTTVNNSGSIFTPTGMGFRRNLPGFPNRASSIAHCWLWNGLDHSTPVNKIGYIHLNHDWLIRNGVNPLNF